MFFFPFVRTMLPTRDIQKTCKTKEKGGIYGEEEQKQND